jgi:hypothetical protein
MRVITLTVIGLLTILPLSQVFADDAPYHPIHFNEGSNNAQGTMDYWDDEGYAKNMLMGSSLWDAGSNNQIGAPMLQQNSLDYSAPQDNSTLQPTSDALSPSDSIMFHSRSSAAGSQDDSYQP